MDEFRRWKEDKWVATYLAEWRDWSLISSVGWECNKKQADSWCNTQARSRHGAARYLIARGGGVAGRRRLTVNLHQEQLVSRSSFLLCTSSCFVFFFPLLFLHPSRRQEVYSQYLRVTWPMASRPAWPNSFARVISFQKPIFSSSIFSLRNCQYHERENNRGESNI